MPVTSLCLVDGLKIHMVIEQGNTALKLLEYWVKVSRCEGDDSTDNIDGPINCLVQNDFINCRLKQQKSVSVSNIPPINEHVLNSNVFLVKKSFQKTSSI